MYPAACYKDKAGSPCRDHYSEGSLRRGSHVSVGIGDGGNELGMGKLKEKVKDLMPKGSLIACDVAADYAITAGKIPAFALTAIQSKH